MTGSQQSGIFLTSLNKKVKTPKQIEKKLGETHVLQITSSIGAGIFTKLKDRKKFEELVEKIAILRGEVNALTWVLGKKLTKKLYG